MSEKIRAMQNTIGPRTLELLRELGREVEIVTFGQLDEECVLPMRDVDWVPRLEEELRERTQGKD